MLKLYIYKKESLMIYSFLQFILFCVSLITGTFSEGANSSVELMVAVPAVIWYIIEVMQQHIIHFGERGVHRF